MAFSARTESGCACRASSNCPSAMPYFPAAKCILPLAMALSKSLSSVGAAWVEGSPSWGSNRLPISEQPASNNAALPIAARRHVLRSPFRKLPIISPPPSNARQSFSQLQDEQLPNDSYDYGQHDHRHDHWEDEQGQRDRQLYR